MKSIIFAICVLFVSHVQAQELNKSLRAGEVFLGLGLGLQYGGIGMRYGVNVADQLLAFGSIGYMVAGPGYNAGLIYVINTIERANLYFLGMYGTNAAIKVQGLYGHNKVYTGPTVGIGIKLNSRKVEGNFWDFGLLVPFTSSEFKSKSDQLKNDPRISDFTKPWPILLSVGYNFNL